MGVATSPIVRKTIYQNLLKYGTAVAIAGAVLVAPHEGLVKKTYIDPVGILTSCYGHTGPELKLGQTFTQEQCDEQLAKDLIKHEKLMMPMIKVPLNDFQKAAFLSFTYNVGPYNFKSSTMILLLNMGKYDQACSELTKWVYAKKIKLPGLVIRRGNELKVCMSQVNLLEELNK